MIQMSIRISEDRESIKLPEVMRIHPAIKNAWINGIPDGAVNDRRATEGGCRMSHATSCGGVVIFRGKILVLYKNYKNKYEGWVLPKGTVEPGEDFKTTALREVKEETDADASIIKYIGKSQYSFNTPDDIVEKEVHWYLMMGDSYYSKPQKEEYFEDSGFYKFHEAYHLLRFANEKQILEQAYEEYLRMKKNNLWGSKKYY